MQSPSFDAPLPDFPWEDPLNATFTDDIIHNEHLGFGLDSNEQDFFNLSSEKAGNLQTDEGALDDSDELRAIISFLALSDGRDSHPFASERPPKVEVVPSGMNPDWTMDPFLSKFSNECWQKRSEGTETPGILPSPSVESPLSPSFTLSPSGGLPQNALCISLNDQNHEQDGGGFNFVPFPAHSDIMGFLDANTAKLAIDLERQLAERGLGQVIDKMKDVLNQVHRRESGYDIERYLQFGEGSVDANTGEQPLPPKLFAPFFETLKQAKNKKLYVCMFCEHSIANRTQIVQHIMGLHFKYFPFKCTKCPPKFDRKVEFYRKADFKKHIEDKHMDVIHLCGVWYDRSRFPRRFA
ncbi:hypothetical protein FRC17_007548 [Serendipita sp. 399]|nr:hypothetical protein FRC17_007548 [Serendipita sp. 399]